jgi:hypothetical protein
MNTQTNQTNSSVQTTGTKRIILASAYRHERHSTGRQERALKVVRKMGRFSDDEVFDHHRMRRISSADETVDD